MSWARSRAPGSCGSSAVAPSLLQVALFAILSATVLGNCGPPPRLPFASPVSKLNITTFEVGTVLQYSCRPGYGKIASKMQLTCDKRGQWKYDEFCIRKRCSNPGELLNGQVLVKTDLFLGAQLEFVCSEGYTLIGSTTSFCMIQERGVDWSDPLPNCVIIQCEPPPSIEHGKHSGRDQVYTYGSSITYSCDPDFSMLGQASISCTVENKTSVWRPDPPVCKKVTCPYPEIKDGKVVSGFSQSYTYKDSVSFTCNKGFILRGHSLLRCEANSQWNFPFPVCELYSCVGFPSIPHSSWMQYNLKEQDQFAVGTVLNYICHLGYRPAAGGPTSVKCQEDLNWTLPTPCEEVCCPEPQLSKGLIIDNPKKHSSSSSTCTYSYRDKVNYSCPRKNGLSSSCQADGTWSPQTPTCECESPPDVIHGQHKVKSWYKSEFIYTCDEGYKLVGANILTCSSSQWSSPAPQCRAMCPKPEIKHGSLSVDKSHYTEPETVTVQCDPGYELAGTHVISCSENRTWTPAMPKCEWVIPEGCEQVKEGRKLLHCLPNPNDVKLALEVYKLSLEIKHLEQERNEVKKSMLASAH